MLAEQAINTLDGNCWVLLRIDGTPADPENESHYPSRDKALEGYAERYRRYEGEELQEVPLLLPSELDEPCRTIVTACGYVLDEANDGTFHQHDAEVLVGWALGAGWAILPDSRMVCSTDPRDCSTCGPLVAGLPPELPPIDGQLTIDGSEVYAGAELPTVVLPDLGPLSPEAEINLGALRRLKP